jgi:PKHD-type hydroxylase
MARNRNISEFDQIILHIEEFARNYNINIKEDEISWSFLKYESGDFFQRHKDVHIDRVSMNSKYIRKVSFSMQLSEPYKYEGGRLLVNSDVDKHIEMSRERGSICMFPSWVSHEVTPVTKGTRYSLVAWQNGPFYQ